MAADADAVRARLHRRLGQRSDRSRRLWGAGAAALPPAIVFAILSPAAVFLAGRWRTANRPAHETGGFTPLTLLGVVAAYELLYWTAGTLVYPYIADFYATRTIPPAYVVAAL